MVAVGHVCYRDGVYYFDGDGFKAYIDAVSFKYGGTNLRAELEVFGCTEGELRYETVKGTERTVACWVKPEDDALRGLHVFYEEVYEEDGQTAHEAGSESHDGEGGGGDGDTRF
jgi:hypothetical protein